jgi:hypothetical protein
MARRKVTLEQKAEALAVYESTGRNASETARLTGFSDVAIGDWARMTDPELLELLDRKKREIGLSFATLTQKLLNRYHEIADTATLEDKGATLLGICADKALLFAGQPNQITESRNITINLVADCEAALQRYTELCGDRDKALADLREDDPEMVAAWEAARPLNQGGAQ